MKTIHTETANTVLMHGPSFDDKADIVERHVPKVDVTAYINAGYKHGPSPTKQIEEAVEKATAEKGKK